MLEERIARFAPRQSKGISYRETGAGPALVLLHGIGSSSGSWLLQFESLDGYRLIAWDAPGYGASAFLPAAEPQAADYAKALHEFLERLLLKDVVLVGNSLGCMMAGAYAAAHPERVRSMRQLDELGPEGLAERRSPTLVGKGAPPIALELVRWSQRRVRPPGYRQAVHCLAQGRLAADARRYGKKVLVACGTEDVITPEAGCKAIARAFPRSEYRSLPGIGHAPHVEAPETVNGMIAALVPR